MSLIDIASTEMKLTKLKGNILNRIKLLERDKKRTTNPLPTSLDDQASATENDVVIESLDSLERSELRNISDAIERIKSGSYGKCLSCGKPIGHKRLNAVPYARCCIDCANN